MRNMASLNLSTNSNNVSSINSLWHRAYYFGNTVEYENGKTEYETQISIF